MRASELIDALGGSAAVAEFLDVEPNTVGNWRKRGFADWALIPLRRLCEQRGVDPAEVPEPSPRRIKIA